MAEKKHSAFALLNILQELTDEKHILSAGQLMKLLHERYNLNIERRTLYSNIDILRQAGYEISDFNDNGKGYYLISRQFEKGEVLLLCNAIHASHFINQKQSDDLINKLLATLPMTARREFKDSVYLPNRLKQESPMLFYNIEVISEAIRERKQLRFLYTHYGKNGKPAAKRKEPYIVEPRYIVYAEGRPYLIVTSHHPGFGHYRIDRIKDPFVMEEPVRPFRKADETEAYKYAENKLFMFAGDEITVTYRCEDRIMDSLIDLLGKDIRPFSQEDGFFYLKVSTTEKGALFLAQQFIDAIEITEPASLRETMKEILKKRYQ